MLLLYQKKEEKRTKPFELNFVSSFKDGIINTLMNKKIIAFIVAIAIFIIAGIIWKQTRPIPKYTGPIEKFTIADVRSVLNTIAKEKGFFAENGLDAQVKDFASGPVGIDALLSGEIDVSPSADFVGVSKIYDHKNLRILAQLSKENVLYVIGRKDKGINKPEDLKGKTIGITEKSIAEFFFSQFLTANNLSPQEVTAVNLAPDELTAQLEKGQIDAVLTWEPFVYRIKKELGDNASIWSAQGDQRFFLLAYSTDRFIKDHPVIIERYLNAMNETAQYIKNNPAEAKAIIAKNYYDDAYMQYFWGSEDYDVRLEQALLPELEREARFLMANKLTNQTEVPNFVNFIYFDALEKIKPEAITIIK